MTPPTSATPSATRPATSSAATSAATSALIGGALWIVQWLVAPGDDPLGLTLQWGGLAFILLAAAAAAPGLVSGDVLPLRLVVTVAAPLLAWSVIEFFRPDGAGWYAGAWGTVAVAVGAWGLWRERESFLPAPRPRGAHAR